MKKIFTILFTLISFLSFSQSTTIVISQVYGAGGNAGAPYNADYVELHNKSGVPQTIDGYTIQYASVSQTGTWSGKSKLPTVTIPAGGYYLVQMSSAGVTNGVALPTPDYVSLPTISMSAKNAKVALVSDTATLSGCPATSNIIDLVGYGTTTVCFETAPTDTLSILRAAFRNNNGCDDTNNNLADFSISSPNPRNSASPIYLCGTVVTTPTLTASSLTAFGNVCINTTVGPNTFTVSGSDLTAGDITVGPLAGFAFSSASGGSYTSSLTIAQTGGTLTATTVYVQFNPTVAQSYNGNISVSGGGATAINVAASASGVSATSATTGSTTAISTSGATINGTLIQGCAVATGYGIEYSTTSFTPGTGTQVASTNLSGSSFSVALSGLTPSTTYYYVVYVTTANGTVYGTVQTFTTQTPSTGGGGIVISQIYGAGGNAGSIYNADYVELHNKSNSSETLSGFSIQYASVSQTGNWTGKSILPTATIPAGGYYLVQMSSAGVTNGVALPTPDHITTPVVSMSQKNGRVALVSDTATLNACPSTSNIIDLVGYGTATVCSETAPTDTLSILRAAFRNNNGCDDTNNNLADFTLATPNPRNSASPVYVCGTVVTTPTLTATSLTAFGNICINTTAGPNSFDISGTDLTAGDITVGPLSGFTFSSASGGTYTSTLTISQSGGTLTATTVYVQFNPTAAQSYDGNISVSGGGAIAINVGASGSGSGSVTPSFTPIAPICTGAQFSLSGTSLNGVIGSWLPAIDNQNTTTYTFTPNASQCATTTTLTVVVNPTSLFTETPVSTCGSYTWNGVTYTTSGTKTWTGANSNGCDSIVTIDITITQSVSPAFTQVAPVCAGGSFTLPGTSLNGINGSWLPAIDNQNTTTYTFTPNAGQCATTATMTVIVSSATTATTGSATAISTSGATISGTLIQGCAAATGYGIEYSTTSFTPGTGTQVASTNLSGSSFSVALSGLSASTTYYYVVYVTTASGTVYGTVQTFTTQTPSTGGSGVVISQVYGAGGNAGAQYNADYVELHNKSSLSETLTGFSIQYASVSATGTWSGKSLLPTLTLPAGGYYLIQMSSASTINGVALPTPDYAATPTISMSAKNGRVALVSDTTTLSGCPITSNIIDLVGYGTATVCSETAPTDTLSILRAAFRNNNGCDDTNNNLADFNISTPNPRNSASPIYLCGTVVTSPTLTTSSLTTFGNVCINTTSGSNTFTVSGTDLTAGDITVGPLAGFSFSSASGGSYTSTLTIAQTGGTLSATTVYVQFNPVAAQSYNGNISVSGGGATAISVAASGSGVSATTATTGSATAISTSGATISGTLIQGCAAATGYGIEYSTTSFTPGTGTQVASTNLSGSSFSVALSGLSASTTYYYVVYVTTASGTVYGTVQTFTTQTPSTGGGSGVVISQVYGGGGGTTGTFNADYVELHNNSGTPQDISGYKIIYGSSAGTLGSVSTNNFTFPSNVVIPAGGYLLVASTTSTGLASLPVSPDYTSTLSISGTNGKIAFGTGSMQSNTSYASQPAGSVLDFVGYGTASEYETAATGALTSTSAAYRNDFGCQDTDDNLANFTINPPLPRNSASPVNLCGPIVGLPRLVVSALDAFADVCPNVTEGPNTFTVSGTDLTTADITVGPLDGYAFSLTSGGIYTSTITISQAGGTLSATTIYVQFTPTLAQSYNGNIPVVGAGANNVNVAAIGSGAITPPTVQTGDSIAINSNSAILRGKITGVGCNGDFSSILTYGIEYSGLQNFTVGSGIKVRSILRYASDSTFYSTINNLVQNAAYYYRAYITTADGIIYGQQKLYITPAVQAGLTVYGTPLHPGKPVHFSVSNVRTDHYGVRMFDMTGRLVCEKNFYLNADGFIDNGGISTRDQFILPGHIAAGVYSFQVSSPDFKIQKLVIVQ